MAKGRKKLPQELLNLRGTARPDRQRDTSVIGEHITVFDNRCYVIGHSKLSNRGKKIFREVCEQLINLKLLESVNLPELLIYSSQFDIYLRAIEELKDVLIEDVYGKDGEVTRRVPSPYIKIANDAYRVINSIGSKYGFSPVDRMKLRFDDTKKGLSEIMLELEDAEYEEME